MIKRLPLASSTADALTGSVDVAVCSEYKNSSTRYYLSLRDILVYIGTFVLQQDINKEVFINIVQNTIKEVSFNNSSLKYVIVTDIRFIHEFEYLNNNNGITIKITRPEVEALDNVADLWVTPLDTV